MLLSFPAVTCARTEVNASGVERSEGAVRAVEDDEVVEVDSDDGAASLSGEKRGRKRFEC